MTVFLDEQLLQVYNNNTGNSSLQKGVLKNSKYVFRYKYEIMSEQVRDTTHSQLYTWKTNIPFTNT